MRPVWIPKEVAFKLQKLAGPNQKLFPNVSNKITQALKQIFPPTPELKGSPTSMDFKRQIKT